MQNDKIHKNSWRLHLKRHEEQNIADARSKGLTVITEDEWWDAFKTAHVPGELPAMDIMADALANAEARLNKNHDPAQRIQMRRRTIQALRTKFGDDELFDILELLDAVGN